jgi:BMFP domain-containing protein YqiC
MDLVTRDEFDVLKARLDAALGEIEALKAKHDKD